MSESNALTSPQTMKGITVLFTPVKELKFLLLTSKNGVISVGSNPSGGLYFVHTTNASAMVRENLVLVLAKATVRMLDWLENVA